MASKLEGKWGQEAVGGSGPPSHPLWPHRHRDSWGLPGSPEQPGPSGGSVQSVVNNRRFYLFTVFLLLRGLCPLNLGPSCLAGEADTVRTKKSIDFLDEFLKTHSRGNILKAERISFARAGLFEKDRVFE